MREGSLLAQRTCGVRSCASSRAGTGQLRGDIAVLLGSRRRAAAQRPDRQGAGAISGGRVDFRRLGAAVHLPVRFLDDAIEVSRYPLAELEHAARAAREVGLRVMGLAELLATLGIPYDSPAAVRLASRVFRVIQQEARSARRGNGAFTRRT